MNRALLARLERLERAALTQHKQDVPPFYDWLKLTTPSYNWDWQHLHFIREKLLLVEKGKIKRLMVFCPPRHGKSEATTIRFPMWCLEKHPQWKIIIGAYNQTLANRFSRKARRLAETRGILSRERAAVEEWETIGGGGVRAAGVGAGITGMGADLIIIDDPVKNREEAESLVFRNRVWDWYTDDLYTRLEPEGAIILIMTRWHTDDLAGRILESEQASEWEVVSLPAIAEENDLLHREQGSALCPERYDVMSLLNIKKTLGSASFTSLYQQKPVPSEGYLFKRQWFQIIDCAPTNVQRVRAWDKAATEGAGDFTSGVLLSRDTQGIFYIEDVRNVQLSSGSRDALIRQIAALDGTSVPIYGEQEPGSSGKDAALAFIRMLSGYSVYCDTVSGSKVVRAQPFAAQCEAGNVKLVKGEWNAIYLDQLCSFPYGKNDDMIDATSLAFNKLSLAQQWTSSNLKSFSSGDKI
jgi:predicted phage terminase large subunit-like protein